MKAIKSSWLLEEEQVAVMKRAKKINWKINKIMSLKHNII